tara:strand:- start:77 stop:343 length:267 start_codon:yes stop_codon:yes gene_type:complete
MIRLDLDCQVKNNSPQEVYLMTWLLMVIILNIQISPPEVKESHIMEMFDSKFECVQRHEQFFKDLKERGMKVPDDFNLGCVPLKMVKI